MSEKTYYRILFAILAVGILCLAVLIWYTADSYLNGSIISYIARERW